MFLAVRPQKAYLSDLNADLIFSFRAVCQNPELVSRHLREHGRKDSESYYYYIRDSYNNARHYSIAQGARFIYLNRTCFNGVFRVSKEGRFNVPHGKRDNTLLPTLSHLRYVSTALRTTCLTVQSFEKALSQVNKGDFVYLDPPYPPLNGTSFFRHYTPDRFAPEDQERLASDVCSLTSRGALVMLSNADIPWIRELYSDSNFSLHPFSAIRSVTSKKKKHTVRELVITNYQCFSRRSVP